MENLAENVSSEGDDRDLQMSKEDAEPYIHDGHIHSNTEMKSQGTDDRVKMDKLPSTAGKQPITINLCTSSDMASIRILEEKIKHILQETGMHSYIRQQILPKEGLDYFEFPPEVVRSNVLILCHSLESKYFSDFRKLDLLYPKFLSYCERHFGRNSILLVVHDIQNGNMEPQEFRRQFFTIQCSRVCKKVAFVMLCGDLSEKLEKADKDWTQFSVALKAATEDDHCQQDTMLDSPMSVDGNLFLSPQLDRSQVIDSLSKAKLPTGGASEGPITVYLCTSSDFGDIEALMSVLSKDLQFYVRRQKLQEDQIEGFTFVDEIDPRGFVVLCHSMKKKYRFVSDNLDKLYGTYLSYCHALFGRKAVVIIYDLPPESDVLRNVRMEDLQRTQPSLFEQAGVVTPCGKLSKSIEMRKADWDKIVRYLKSVLRKSSRQKLFQEVDEEIRQVTVFSNFQTEIQSLSVTQTSKINKTPGKKVKKNSSKSMTSRKYVIYLCTSSHMEKIKVLESTLREYYANSDIIDVQQQKLPRSGLDNFRFPPDICFPGVMILYHSMLTTELTEELATLYSKYLQYCKELFGKRNIAVIVDDSVLSTINRCPSLRQNWSFSVAD